MIRKVYIQGKMHLARWQEVLLSKIWENLLKETNLWEEKLSWGLASMDLLKLREIRRKEEKPDRGEEIGECK